MKGNALVAHGGGPTAVINASLVGLVDGCRGMTTLYGARGGIKGILEENFIDLLSVDRALLASVRDTPASAIGSSRQKLAEADYERILAIFRKRDIRHFFYTGGNGSMDTALRFSNSSDLRVIGIPKTIDNDLAVTDHTPGYPSTARFFAEAARDIGEDNRSLPSPVCVLEVLGRNAGWVVAATCLARKGEDDAPHLIYFPERRVSLETICGDVERVYRRLGRVVIAVCEGQLDEQGLAFGADVDRPASAVHRLSSNLGHTLARLITEKTGLRARAEKPGLLGRSCGPFATELDRREAYECGLAAASAERGMMVALRRDSRTFLTPLETVARKERLLPLEWIAPEGNDILPAFAEYARPLVGEIVHYPHLY